MTTVRRWVARWWRGEGGASGAALSVVTLPLEWAFRLASGARRRAYGAGVLRSSAAGIPVVAVGNLTVGGTGKTPLAGWITRMLLEEGWRPAVVRRPYGDDETLLHRRWNPGAVVVADSNRLRGILDAVSQGADVAVLDDGFQHLRVRRGLDVVVVSCEQGLEGRCLPRGPFRERSDALGRADLVIVSRKGAPEVRSRALADAVREQFPDLPVARVRFRAGSWTDLAGVPAAPPYGEVLAVSSVAEPESFLAMARDCAEGGVESMAFPDHHPYDLGDIERIQRRARGRVIVTTEKDAVKLTELKTHEPGVRVLPMELRWDEGEALVKACIRDSLEAWPRS